ncbi:MAG: hypothetical protein EBV03_01440 [Proteobacteria bacterium]|nr:hypothetical protein [Pseudomonadota bacterium]
MPLLHVESFLQKSSTPLHAIRGKDSIGRDCYFVLMCSMKKLPSLLAAMQQSNVNLTRYGQIVVSGFGTKPDEQTRKMLKEKYGLDWPF